MEWMILPFKRYAEFSGRSRRMEYWMFALLNFIVAIVCYGLMFASAGPVFFGAENPAALDGGPGPLFWLAGIVLLVWFLAALVPSIAVVVRRLHDRDMSGWWYLGVIVASFIPIINFIAAIAFLVLMVLPGTPGPNRYGPDPKGQGDAEAFA